jgi:hypothetical protein
MIKIKKTVAMKKIMKKCGAKIFQGEAIASLVRAENKK